MQTTSTAKNKVLNDNFRASKNFYQSDQILQHFIKNNISTEGQAHMQDKWETLGERAAGIMNELSLTADKETPKLIKRNFYGEMINEIRFHPAYHQMTQMAIDSQMFRVKWEPQLRQQFQTERHRLGFVSGFLFAMSECGLFCPLCMTDGVARLIDRYCTDADKERLLPHIATTVAEELYTGAMFLTEKAGGSDVGANLVTATHWKDDYYLLNGEKWFCSNANAEIIFALARTDEEVSGTKGLSIFMIEKTKPDGSKNTMNVVRLKDKLGVRSMASAEIILTDTVGKLVGKVFQGFKIMTDMINLSRLYNSIAAIGASRRAVAEAYQFLKFRTSFGTNALNHALIREKLTELNAHNLANFYLSWRAIIALDQADNGNKDEAQLLRLLTPMVKKSTATDGVYVIREAMELMGGMGYIEDGVMPKIFRDALVLPIWEGASNIMILDMLRALHKSAGLNIMVNEIASIFSQLEKPESQALSGYMQELLNLIEKASEAEKDVLQLTAKPLFERLTLLYQIALLIHYRDEESAVWIDPALGYLVNDLERKGLELRKPLGRESVEAMTAWVL